MQDWKGEGGGGVVMGVWVCGYHWELSKDLGRGFLQSRRLKKLKPKCSGTQARPLEIALESPSFQALRAQSWIPTL